MPDNEIWCTGKSKKKDEIKTEDLEILRRNGKVGKLQEKPQLCTAGFNKAILGRTLYMGIDEF
jgi:hypothetical protein